LEDSGIGGDIVSIALGESEIWTNSTILKSQGIQVEIVNENGTVSGRSLGL
jgi:hypothetical protein